MKEGIEMRCCRLCAKSDKLEKLQPLFKPRNGSILQQILDITGLKLRNIKNLPEHICTKCSNGLKQAHQFRERCIQAHKCFSNVKYKKDRGTKVKLNTNFKIQNEEIIQPKRDLQDLLHEFTDPTDVGMIYDENNEGQEFITGKITIRTLVRKEPLDAPELINEGRQRQAKAANRYICEQCGNHFNSRNHFVTHLRRHAGDKQFQCEICAKEFLTNSELRRHMRRHTGEKPYCCRYCDRRFADYSSHKKHERTHTNERPYSCNECGKSFAISYVLKNHMLTHSGARTHICQLCNKAFPRATNLATHYRTLMHKQNEQRKLLPPNG